MKLDNSQHFYKSFSRRPGPVRRSDRGRGHLSGGYATFRRFSLVPTIISQKGNLKHDSLPRNKIPFYLPAPVHGRFLSVPPPMCKCLHSLIFHYRRADAMVFPQIVENDVVLAIFRASIIQSSFNKSRALASFANWQRKRFATSSVTMAHTSATRRKDLPSRSSITCGSPRRSVPIPR